MNDEYYGNHRMNHYNNSSQRNATTHGLSQTPLYKIWKRIMYKVRDNKVEIDPEWLYLEGFMDSMDESLKVAKHISMAKIDPNGPYNKTNCIFKIG